jgi:hypothetical protein
MTANAAANSLNGLILKVTGKRYAMQIGEALMDLGH